MILAGYFTGARLVDLVRLTWGDVDLSERTITFVQRKTGASVQIPIHPELYEYLLALPKSGRLGCLICRAGGTQRRTRCARFDLEDEAANFVAKGDVKLPLGVGNPEAVADGVTQFRPMVRSSSVIKDSTAALFSIYLFAS